MDYKEKYKQALERAKESLNDGTISQNTIDYLYGILPELKESEDEKIRKALIWHLTRVDNEIPLGAYHSIDGVEIKDMIAWLEKQGEQKPTQEIEPFEAEHGKYYYCIKDYFCGGRKQASKGDVVQALRGLPIMGLKDASEYFLPVSFIKCNSAWSEDDDWIKTKIMKVLLGSETFLTTEETNECVDWLKSLKQRIAP